MKIRITEEFLWKMNEVIQSADESYGDLVPYNKLRKKLRPELEKIKREYDHKKRQKSFSQFISYLKREGYIKIPQGYSVYDGFTLTEKGKGKALRGKIMGKKLKPREDGKMIMVMFDIPKQKEKVRFMFCDTLKFLDYQILQRSVWVSEKDVLKETEEVLKEYGLDNYVNIFVIESIKHKMCK